MAYMFHISIPLTEKKLHEWIQEMISKKEISPSLVFRDAMLEKRREWEIIHARKIQDPVVLMKQIDLLKLTIGKFSSFMAEEKQVSEKYYAWLDKQEEERKKEIEVEKIEKDKSNLKQVKGGEE